MISGTYKKDYERRKKDSGFMENKRLLDKIYREKKKAGIDVSRKRDDGALVNTNWSEYQKQWVSASGYNEYKALRSKHYYAECRDRVIDHYSNGAKKCAMCGCDDIRVLDIDHINNDGAAHRKKIGSLV